MRKDTKELTVSPGEFKTLLNSTTSLESIVIDVPEGKTSIAINHVNFTQPIGSLSVKGRLEIGWSDILKAPKELHADSLCFHTCHIKDMPKTIECSGGKMEKRNWFSRSIEFYRCVIDDMPKTLNAQHVTFAGCMVSDLPREINCQTLIVADCNIALLPEKISAEWIDIQDCSIAELPENLNCECVFLGEDVAKTINLNGFDQDKVEVVGRDDRSMSYKEYMEQIKLNHSEERLYKVCVSNKNAPFSDQTPCYHSNNLDDCVKYCRENAEGLLHDSGCVDIYNGENEWIGGYRASPDSIVECMRRSDGRLEQTSTIALKEEKSSVSWDKVGALIQDCKNIDTGDGR